MEIIWAKVIKHLKVKCFFRGYYIFTLNFLKKCCKVYGTNPDLPLTLKLTYTDHALETKYFNNWFQFNFDHDNLVSVTWRPRSPNSEIPEIISETLSNLMFNILFLFNYKWGLYNKSYKTLKSLKGIYCIPLYTIIL